MCRSDYTYSPEWSPKYHYEFSKNGDTLMKIEPLPIDSSLFELTEFQDDGNSSKRLFRLNTEGQREFLTEVE